MFGFGKKKVVKPIELISIVIEPTGADRIALSLDSFVKAKEDLIQGVEEVNFEKGCNEDRIKQLEDQNTVLEAVENRATKSIGKLTEILGG